MRDERPRPRSLESLRKEAKRWHAALLAGDTAARARFERIVPANATPVLRDVQHALAREHGVDSWAALTAGIAADADTGEKLLGWYEAAVDALLDAYRTGTAEAMERHYNHTWHRRAWHGMRRYVQLDLGLQPTRDVDDDVDITLADARLLVAREYGFASWDELRGMVRLTTAKAPLAIKPVTVMDAGAPDGSAPVVTERDWDVILATLGAQPSARLVAEGPMTDEVLARMAKISSVTALNLGGSKALSDAGVRHLATMAGLRHLDLSGTAITDRGLAVLKQLPALESLSLAGTAVTDEGAAQLAHCRALRSIDLSWTHTGDGALRALGGMEQLHRLRSGAFVTDAGLPLLHEMPAFKKWRGGEERMALLSPDVLPNKLTLRGSFTDRGMAHFRGLDGLFGLDLDDATLALTAAALIPLVELPHLAHLAVDAKDDWMPLIAAMPRLRFLIAQDTACSDDGFAALARSQTLEYLWGRRCHNLRDRGFAALASMPTLRELSVSCLNVSDDALSALPTFPSLRVLMPMDVPDAGYRHIGACERLEELILMYCRDATDRATEQITGLSRLSYYFNSYSTITDRTPELLAGIGSLERVTFDSCHSLTDAGIGALARLPRLRELRVSGRGITGGGAAAFRSGVSVHWSH